MIVCVMVNFQTGVHVTGILILRKYIYISRSVMVIMKIMMEIRMQVNSELNNQEITFMTIYYHVHVYLLLMFKETKYNQPRDRICSPVAFKMFFSVKRLLKELSNSHQSDKCFVLLMYMYIFIFTVFIVIIPNSVLNYPSNSY